MIKNVFLTLMALSAVAVFFSCSSGDNEDTNNNNGMTNSEEDTNHYEGQRGIVTEDQEVDLGLMVTIKSREYRVIFAKSNLTAKGLAEKESDFGDYFAWGATDPWLVSYTVSGDKLTDLVWKNDKSSGYTWENAPYCDPDSAFSYMKYINGESLDASDDAARQILGGDWQLPPREVWIALCESTTAEKVSTGTPGFKFTKNDKTIFLPAAGNVVYTSSYNVGLCGYYWSVQDYTNRLAWNLYFTETSASPIVSDIRYHGFTIRPVRLIEK